MKPINQMTASLADLKTFVRQALKEGPEMETESEKRHFLSRCCQIPVSANHYKVWAKAVNDVLKEKPSEKLRRPAEDFADEETRRWAARHNLLK